MTYENTKRENTRNAAPAILKMLQHLTKSHDHHFYGYEQRAIEALISGATCNENTDLLSEEYFDSIVNPIVYH